MIRWFTVRQDGGRVSIVDGDVKPTLEAIRVRATRLHVGFSQTWSIRARIVHTQLSFSLVSPVRSFRSPLFLREKKMRITNAILEIGNGVAGN